MCNVPTDTQFVRRPHLPLQASRATTEPSGADREVERPPKCPHDSIEELRAALERDEVTFPMAMKALYLQRPEWNDNEASRSRYCELYPKLCEAFIRHTDGLRESLYANQFAAGVALTKDCELYTAIWWEDFPFNTAPARFLEAEISDLRVRAELYLSGEAEKIFMQRVLRLYIGLISTLRREWKRHSAGTPHPNGQAASDPGAVGAGGHFAQGPPAANGDPAVEAGAATTGQLAAGPQAAAGARPATPEHVEDLNQLRNELILVESTYRGTGTDYAETRYIFGVAAGTVAIVALAGLLAALLSDIDHTIWLGALAGGAVGGLLSVLERYTRGKLQLQFEAERLWLKGVTRPVVGALSGVALYVLINAGFLPLDIRAEGTELGLAFAGLGLIAGFSERLLKDVIEKASQPLTRDEQKAEAAAAAEDAREQLRAVRRQDGQPPSESAQSVG